MDHLADSIAKLSQGRALYLQMLTNAYKSSSDRRSGSTCWVSSNSVFLGFSGSSPVGFIASL